MKKILQNHQNRQKTGFQTEIKLKLAVTVAGNSNLQLAAARRKALLAVTVTAVVRIFGFWWSATEYVATHAWYRRMLYNYDLVYRDNWHKTHAMSVRCVRDD